MEVIFYPVIPVHAISFVDGVDGPFGGELHLGMRQDEFAERVFHGEAVYGTAAHGDDELSGSAVHGEPGGDELCAIAQDVLCRHRLSSAQNLVGQTENAEDGADRNTSVEVRGAVDGVADDGVAGIRVLVEDDCFLFFFGDEETHFAGAAHGGDEDVVADYVEFLLVVAGCVGGAG